MLHEKANTWNKIEGRLLASLLNNLSNSHAKKQSNAHQSYTRCYHYYLCLNDQSTLTVWEERKIMTKLPLYKQTVMIEKVHTTTYVSSRRR